MQWPDSWAAINIAVKEMVPVVLAIAIWGRMWIESTVSVRSYNMALIHTLNAKDLSLSLLCCLHFYIPD